MSILFNGLPVVDLAQSRGLHYGDGVFRTILIWDAQLIDWTLQMEKLSADCAALDLHAPDFEQLQIEARQLADGQARAVLKIMITRRTSGRGYRYETTASDRLLLRYAAPQYSEDCWDRGIITFCSEFRLASQPELAGIKHLNRLENVMASRHWQHGADEGILCDQAGQVIGGTRSNLFWVNNGVLYTPSLGGSGVSGMMRKKIMTLAESMKLTISVAKSPRAELQAADEAFVCNSLIGIWPIRRFEQREWSAPGPVSSQLMAALLHPRLV